MRNLKAWEELNKAGAFSQDLSEKIETIFDFRFDEKGNVYVAELGTRNVQEEIESHADDVGIYNLIAKYNLTGDANIFNQGNAQFMDTAGMPDNLNDQNEMAAKAAKTYAELDPALTGGKTLEEFITQTTQEQIEAYIKARIEKETTSDEQK